MTREAIEAVRKTWPNWSDAMIVKHLQQRERLQQMAQQQHRRELAQCLQTLAEVRR